MPFRGYLLTRVRVGSPSPITVVSPIDIEVVDEEATEALRERVREHVPVVYRYDNGWSVVVYDRISKAFFNLRGLIGKGFLDRQRVQEILKRELGVDLKPEAVDLLMQAHFSFELETLLADSLKKISSYYIADRWFPDKPVVIYDPKLKRYITSVERDYIFRYGQVRGLVEKVVSDIFPLDMGKYAPAVVELLSRLVKPTLYYDESLTKRYAEREVSSVEPVRVRLRKGEVIVSEGQKVTREIYRKLKILSDVLDVQPLYKVVAGLFLFAFLSSLLFSVLWFRLYTGGRVEPHVAHRLSLFLVFEALFLMRFFGWFYSKTFAYASLGKLFLGFASPVFLVGLLSVFIFGYPAAVVPIVFTGVLSSFLPASFEYMPLVVVASSFAAGFGVLVGRGANAFLRGIVWGSVSLLFFLFAALVYEPQQSWMLLVAFLLAAVSVFFCSFASLPLFEKLFGVVTDMSLLELANLDHPLLRMLLEKAPGTYNHSMYVGILAETAAREVGANPILAKVGGYFHDIGKLKNPKYFIENTMGVSMHTKLSPNMSRLIIISHVKDGVELAKQHNLPKCVIDIIEQHHGTSLISYFYHKAKQVDEDVDESLYRYPGPKPRSKEAAIVMLADCVEAATRSLDEPTPSRIKNLVSSVINGIFTDGQLDECDLTFREVKRVQEVLVKMLISLYHKRVKYPEQEKREERSGGNGSKPNGASHKG